MYMERKDVDTVPLLAAFAPSFLGGGRVPLGARYMALRWGERREGDVVAHRPLFIAEKHRRPWKNNSFCWSSYCGEK